MGQGLDAVTALRAPFGDRLRHDDVIAECAAADVLCVQELFSREAQRFFDGVGRDRFVSRFRDDNRVRFATMRGTGLGVGARARLEKSGVHVFPGERVGWDRLARKGALYTQMVVEGGAVIDLVTVHLQAGQDEGAVRVRAAQLLHLKSIVASVGSPDRPMIVCGDLNIDGLTAARGDLEYGRLTAAFEGFEDLGAATDLPTFDPHPERNALAHAFDPKGRAQRIDYVFWRAGRRADLHCTSLTRFFDRPLAQATPSSAWASDHFGLTATFELR
jgi:endonuclease/exonuclease/phosphatase family metal-dependent hydrolase